jgi:hypothetical protein
MSHALNLVAEILLIRTYDLGLTGRTMNDSPFQVMWVVGFELQITACVSTFPVHF